MSKTCKYRKSINKKKNYKKKYTNKNKKNKKTKKYKYKNVFKRSGGGCPECVDLLIQFFDDSRKYYGGDKYGAVDIKKAKEVEYIKSSEKKQCYTCKDGICPLPKVGCDSKCTKYGKSDQIVTVCEPERTNLLGIVYKMQPYGSWLRPDKSVLEKNINGDIVCIKLDSFNMNFIQQHLMKYISENDKENFVYDEIAYIETFNNQCVEPIKAIDVTSGELSSGLAFVYDKSDYVLENILLNNEIEKEQLLFILDTVFRINNKLYNKCQFQHCDMKTAQILLKDTGKEGREKYVPIISDFDKSTCSIKINGSPTRLIIRKSDAAIHNQHSYYKGKAILSKVMAMTHTHKTILGYQEIERYEIYPLKDNSYYNVCLLASVLLLAERGLYNGIIKEDKGLIKKYLEEIDLGKIIETRKSWDNEGDPIANKDKRLTLTGNKEATICIKREPSEYGRAESISSEIDLENIIESYQSWKK